MNTPTAKHLELRWLWGIFWMGWMAVASSVQASRVTDFQRELAEAIDRASQSYVKVGGGSGAVISPDGYVLTNYHVVAKRLKQEWTIEVPRHGIFKARVQGVDATDRGDIALLKLVGAKDLPYLELSPSDDLQVGQWVFTLGNPYTVATESLVPSASLGVVSAVHVANGFYDDGIQTDASINPGNSGGPLLDVKGRLVGIAGKHAVRWNVRTSTGANYAVGASRVLRMLDRLKTGDTIYPNRLEGVQWGSETGVGTVAVKAVIPGSQAERAGLLAGDQVSRLDGKRVTSVEHLSTRLATYAPGAPLNLDVIREGSPLQIATVLTHRMDPLHDATIRDVVESLMRGHQHLPHPMTKKSLCLDFEGCQEPIEWLGKNQARMVLRYLDAEKQSCEVDVMVQVSPQGQHKITRTTVGKIGDQDFRQKKNVSPTSDEGIVDFVRNLMAGHQHLPHPKTKASMCLDFEGARERVERLEGDQARVVLLYRDKEHQACEVDVVVQVGSQGPLQVVQSTVGKIGATMFRP